MSFGTRSGINFSYLAIAALLIAASPAAQAAVLAGWDVHAQRNFGTSPLAATVADPNLTVGPLTRGSGLTTVGTASARAWGATDWNVSSSYSTRADAESSNKYVTFTVNVSPGYVVSFNSVSMFGYHRNSTGPSKGVFQYNIGGSWVDAYALDYAYSSSGLYAGPIPLQYFSELQSVTSGTTIQFRIMNWNCNNSAGTWYIYDSANTTANDFEISGTVTPVSQVRVETKADGSGTVVPAQNLAQGGSLTVYAIARNSSGGFVGNIAPDSWSLNPVTGDVVQADLATWGDHKFAVYTAAHPGTAVIHISSGTLTNVASGVIATKTNPSGIGNAVPASVSPGQSVRLEVAVTPGDHPTSTGLAVTADLTLIGGGTGTAFFDDGTHGDVTAGDNVFSYQTTVGAAIALGAKTLPVTVTDGQSRQGTTGITLVVTSALAATGLPTSPVSFDQSVLLKVQVTPGANPASTGIAVTVDLTTIGSGSGTVFYDDGTHGDEVAGDNIYSLLTSVPWSAGSGSKTLPVSVTDAQSRSATASIALVVLSPTDLAAVGAASPSSVAPSGSVLLQVQVTPGTNPASSGITVTGNLSPIGGGTSVAFYDDGTHGDPQSGDHVYSFQAAVPWATTPGAKSLPVTVADVQGRITSAPIALTVLSPSNPTIVVAATPSSVTFNQTVLLTATVTLGANPPSTGITVTGDLSTIGGGSAAVFHDDGLGGDATAGDRIYSYQTTVPSSAGVGAKSLPVTMSDSQSRHASATIALSVTGTATVTLSGLAQTYDGTAKPVTVTTTPPGLTTSVTYNGSSTVPVHAGSYPVSAVVTQSGYTGSATGTLVIAKAAQTINFPALSPVVVGAPPFSVTVSVNSGLPVTLTSGNTSVATVSGTTVTVVAVGTATLTATQAGDADHLAATAVSRDLVVNSSTLPATVTLTNLAQTYDGTAKAVTVTTAPAGLSVSVTYNGASTVPVHAGSYAVSAVVTQSGYSGSATGTLVIAKATQIITFPALTPVTLGVAPFGVSASASSGLALTITSSDTSVATVSGTTVTVVGAGTATLTATQLGNSDYFAATAVSRDLVVNPSSTPATVTLTNLAQTYDGASKTVTVTTVPADLTVAVTYNGVSAVPVHAGSYAVSAVVTQSGYSGSATGTLVVAQAVQTITFGAFGPVAVTAPPFGASVSSDSGLPVTLTSSNPAVATVSGTTVTVASVGTTDITATQAGDADHLAAASVTRTLTVTNLPLPVPATPVWALVGLGLALLAVALYRRRSRV